MKKTIILSLFLTGLLFLTPGCAKNSGGMKPAAEEQIHFVITQNYGQEMLLEKKINYQKNITVLNGLFETGAAVETSYGGGYVSGINGLKTEHSNATGTRKDWFYYVNGVFADTGVLDYLLQPGEKIWWDYHPWKTSQGTPAVIGCFPEPFLHGYRGQVGQTVILTLAQNAKDGLKLQKALQAEGVSHVATGEITAGLLEKRKGPTVVIGEWKELEKFPWLKNFNKAYQRNGTFLHFTGSGLELLDYNGQVVREIQNEAGALLATGEGNGDGSPLWLVTGTDKSGTAAALDVLNSHPEKIKAAYSAVIFPEEMIKLPLMR